METKNIIIEYTGTKIPTSALNTEADWLEETINESLIEQDFSDDVKIKVEVQ